MVSQPVKIKHKNHALGLHQSAQNVEFVGIRERIVQIWLNSLFIKYYVILVDLRQFELSEFDVVTRPTG